MAEVIAAALCGRAHVRRATPARRALAVLDERVGSSS